MGRTVQKVCTVQFQAYVPQCVDFAYKINFLAFSCNFLFCEFQISPNITASLNYHTGRPGKQEIWKTTWRLLRNIKKSFNKKNAQKYCEFELNPLKSVG